MIRIEPAAWTVMIEHARRAYPKECCGILLGTAEGEDRLATEAVPCRNAYEGDQSDRFLLDPKEQLAADRRARELGINVLGFFHSHPDCDAYFSQTDLKNSWPWYSNIVLAMRQGRFDHARCFRANEDQTGSHEEELTFPNESGKEQTIWQKS